MGNGKDHMDIFMLPDLILNRTAVHFRNQESPRPVHDVISGTYLVPGRMLEVDVCLGIKYGTNTQAAVISFYGQTEGNVPASKRVKMPTTWTLNRQINVTVPLPQPDLATLIRQGATQVRQAYEKKYGIKVEAPIEQLLESYLVAYPLE